MSNDGPQRLALPWWQIFLVGALVGAVSFLFAMAAMPKDVPDPSQHDLLLANNLGFIFPLLIGFWSGIVQGSLRKTLVGIAIGTVIGGLYKLLCGYDFLAVMVVYPCLLGGVAAAAFGSGQKSWSEGILLRFLKGLIAGFALGFIYMVVLNVVGATMMPFVRPPVPDLVVRYRHMMWRAGTVALSLATGVFLVLFHWAANLYRQEPPSADPTLI